uniref:uncharacterized protein LOC122609171 n=1 Tax=Erigeron canadensis TaxID=72917 RepID=UPI001CB92285|nr:uncharacterized protein LOC122609171 [Erigeron canadensis]
MEKLEHFDHYHLLHLVHMQWNKKNENSDDEEEEDEDEDEFVEETTQSSYGECKMCREPIYSFQLCYYKCMQCAADYSLHKFCAELPVTLENHPSHPSHNVFNLDHDGGDKLRCDVCHRNQMLFYYYCPTCFFKMDMICATIPKQKMDHPSHPHQLQRMSKLMVSSCDACGNEHKGTFYQCTTCFQFWIHVDCALLPKKLQIQDTTGGIFTHSHPLTLAYSLPSLEKEARFDPRCRVCGGDLDNSLWHYRCDKCWYYTHVDCATSKKDVWSTSLAKTSKNFEDKDHPNLLRLPFIDESDNLLKHSFFNQKDHQLIPDETNKDGKIMLNHASHQHPLILLDTNTSQLIAADKSLSLHDPMKRNQLLCDGCVRPIMTVPFYRCSRSSQLECGFVLHKWCADLPSRLHDHPDHPKHTLDLMMPHVREKFYGVFDCAICWLPSNGFAYGCTTCAYYVDINCAFIPEEITHEAHPNHILSRIDTKTVVYSRYCNACNRKMDYGWGFGCRSCDFCVHTKCAFLLPSMIRHKLDKHTTLNLRYGPVENHISEYFCEVCENGLNPTQWFYHCSICAQSVHAVCAPLILEYEQYSSYKGGVFSYINVKSGGTL